MHQKIRQTDGVKQQIIILIKENIRNTPDFPEPINQFLGITPLLQSSDKFELTPRYLTCLFRYMDMDYVVGLEVRGLFIRKQSC